MPRRCLRSRTPPPSRHHRADGPLPHVRAIPSACLHLQLPRDPSPKRSPSRVSGRLCSPYLSSLVQDLQGGRLQVPDPSRSWKSSKGKAGSNPAESSMKVRSKAEESLPLVAAETMSASSPP